MSAGEYGAPRDVAPDDGENGLLELLSQLTKAPAVEPEAFKARVAMLNRDGDGDAHPRQLCLVVPRRSDGRIVATASVTFEYKFIRNLGVCAHIEDVVVDSSARHGGLGRVVVDACVSRARQVAGCYKVILDCNESNVPFYERCGFSRKEVQMALYFE